MRYILLLLLFPVFCSAQFSDDFNDGDFSSPSWSGDTSLFLVDQGKLRLSDSVSGNAVLFYTKQALTTHLEHEWSFELQLDFAPSSQNYARYYLFSDSALLQNAVNALYLQFGESGSNDAPELFLVQNAITQSLARGTNGSIANDFTFQYTVRCDSLFNWTLWQGTIFNTPEFSLQQPLMLNGYYSGWLCNYTSGNSSAFYLDNVYEGNVRYDTIPPSILNCTGVTGDSVFLTFNEPVDISQAVFLVNGDTGTADLLTDLMSVIVHVSPLTSNQVCSVTIFDLKDLHNNLNTLNTCSFQYIEAVPPVAGELIINEIMADPDGALQLPQAEYIELYNRSNHFLLTEGMILSDGSSDATLLADTISPDEYRIYSSLASAILLNTIGIQCTGLSAFPSLNNDGDPIMLKSASEVIIDNVNYSSEMYYNDYKSDGGWSLERIDSDYPCFAQKNWSAAVDNRGGSPGSVNSVNGYYSDTGSPCLLYAAMTDSTIIRLVYSEPMDTITAVALSNYSIGNATVSIINVMAINNSEFELQLSAPLSGIMEITAQDAIMDCAQNHLRDCNSVIAGYGKNPGSGELFINEILFNPYPESSDFIEIINAGNSILVLDSLMFASEKEDGTPDEIIPLNASGRCIAPGEIIAFTAEPDNLKFNYRSLQAEKIIKSVIPAMNDDEGRISLQDRAFRQIDRVNYSEKWHHPLLASAEGVSLERISTDGASIYPESWHSASSACGYATPGKTNSQSGIRPGNGDLIELAFSLFSPDNDGEKDFLAIRINTPTNGFAIRLTVFNTEGIPVRSISENDLSGADNFYNWDGQDEDGMLQPPGVYILCCEAVHPDGIVKKDRKVCVLVRRF